MKKLSIVVFLLLLLAVLAGCTQTENAIQTAIPAPSQSAAAETSSPSLNIQKETPEPTPVVTNVSDVQMTLSFAFGERTGIYTGELLDGLPHGTGHFISQNDEGISWTYEGSWKKGHMDGDGTTVWDDGFQETGMYVGDYLNGQGAEYENNILLYEGEYENSVFHGQGKLLNCVGKTIYEGNFSNGFIDESAEARKARLAPFLDQCQTIVFQEYANNNQAYIGKDIVFTGRIFDAWIYEGEEYYGDLLVYEQDNTSNILSVVYNYSLNEAPFQKDTMINIWGTISGMFTYTTEDGRELTVPEIEAWNIEQLEP